MPDEKFVSVGIESLFLDPENPRLRGEEDWTSKNEAALLKEFYARYNLTELAYSISDKGFTPRFAESLHVISKEGADDQYIVVEGNRRLAALKLLADADLRKEVGVNRVWDELAAQAAEKKLDLDNVPVVIYADRASLDDYLGFRHITGPTPWRPEAKARFIARLLNTGEKIDDVAKRIGSNRPTVRRFAEAHSVYAQAIKQDLPIDQVEAAFGIFYNALGQPGVRGFIGLGKQSENTSPLKDPIPEDHLQNLKELLGLLYGTADDEGSLDKAISESRDLKRLGEILGDDRGRRSLLADRDLNRAWRMVGGGRQELLALLEGAHSRLAEANGQSKEFNDDEDVQEEVRRIRELVQDMCVRFGLGSD